MRVIKLNTILIALIITLYSSLCTADDKIDRLDYPVSQETMDELKAFLPILEDLRKDINLIKDKYTDWQILKNIDKLNGVQTQIEYEFLCVFYLLMIESNHKNNFNPQALLDIALISESFFSEYNDFIEILNDALPIMATQNYQADIQFYLSNLTLCVTKTEELMQKVTGELRNSAEEIKSNSYSP